MNETYMQREFKGVWFPQEIWDNREIDFIEKGILIEIDSFTSQTGACFMTNASLADKFQCSERKVSSAIAHLIELGYVYVSQFDGRKRYLKSALAYSRVRVEKNAGQPSKICEAESQNLRHNNTTNNTINNSINNNVELPLDNVSTLTPSREIAKAGEDIPYQQIIDYLNMKAGTAFRASTKNTRKAIKARWREKWRLDDFKKVIDNKCVDWLYNPDMKKYLCPDTLFGTKFEKYWNQTSNPTLKQVAGAFTYPNGKL